MIGGGLCRPYALPVVSELCHSVSDFLVAHLFSAGRVKDTPQPFVT